MLSKMNQKFSAMLILLIWNQVYSTDWSNWIPCHSQTSGNNCWIHATCTAVEGLLHKQINDSLNKNLMNQTSPTPINLNEGTIGGPVASALDYIKNNKIVSYVGTPLSFPNFSHAYWTIKTRSNAYTNSSFTAISNHLDTSPVIAEIEYDDGDPDTDHAIVIIAAFTENSIQKYKIKDPTKTYFETIAVSAMDEIVRYYTFTVDNSCLAKIGGGIFSSLTSTVMDYSWHSSEWAYIYGSCSDVYMKPSKTVYGVGANSTITGTVYFNSDNNATLDNVTIEDPISVTSSSGIKIYRTDADFTSGNAIDMSGSSADIWDFETSSVYRGVYPHNSSDADISYSDITSSSYGLYIDGSSSAYLDEISFCSNTNYDIYLASGGNIEIEENSNSFSDDPEYSTYGVSSSDLPEY